ncbi:MULTISPECIES: hypothetical protein [unclassified Clostridioides]|uniref:hypothetical protein n=1 Tax=unclassified Clostridioides TaxID=2635829 RepID=UPI001D120724|nr:hypothetical protein [Clostridioides sp. ZZV15-6388]MCC0660415.1 hypothetical protein [Clostridioides sp. ZZV14-6154]MCC0719711.1 hypothetical protein [Clostridioides sp. ZZV14-6105]MCC0720783.1 hypothetical protein [Clostridioides sp. ZZV14-6104]MCC0741408.1 hypothetical protein [Clostridioides sp. ZZV14-6044]MCC0750103.1 hypothetical protein [Clostridioides sp. ZZV13-5731]
MQKYLTGLEHKEENIYKVNLIHNMPFDKVHGLNKSAQELELNGILVDEVVEAEQREGFTSIMYVDKATKEITYEYVEIPLTPEQEALKKIKELEQENANINYALMMGGLI